jgi:hypothetical protein
MHSNQSAKDFDADKLIELFHERAAIRQYCGGESRTDAELASYAELRKLVGRHPDGRAVALPIEIRRVVSGSVNKEFAK